MINEAVILLGGMGTRMLPYTKTVPKEMMPIYDVPNIFLLVEECFFSDIKKIIFVVTKHNKELIEKFFSNDNYLNNFLKDKPDKEKLLTRINNVINNITFEYVYQDKMGTYGALYSAKDYIKNDNFIVLYGDDLIDSKIPITKQLIYEFKKEKKQLVLVYEENNTPDVGLVVTDNNNKLLSLEPKIKTNSKLIIQGRMLLNKKIFTVFDKLYKHANNEYYLPYALLYFDDVYVFRHNEKYFNIGEKTGYIKASINYALKDEKERQNIIDYINNLKEE